MPASGKKKKKGSGSLALGAEDTGSAGGSKGSEEASFGDDVEDPMSSKSIFLNDKIADFQQQHPDTFKEITAMFSDESSMMVVISAYENYEDKAEFDDLLSLNADVVRAMIANGRFSKPAFQGLYRALPSVKDLGYTNDGGPNPKEVAIVEEHIKKPTKEVIRKKFERPKGGSMLLNRWTVAHTHVLEDLVADALDGTGLNAAEILHLNVDGSCFLNAIVPVQGDSVASSAVLKGSSGRFFGDLKYTSKQSNQVVGAAPLKITELSGKVLQFPYYLDSKNPLTETEFAALNFFNEIFAGCLSMNDSVLTRDYMTMAAKFAIAQECILGILRTTCQLIYELDNQASWANILASQGLSGSNLRENPNVYAYTTPTMLAARAKYPYLDRGTYAIRCFMESLRNARGKEQMQPLIEMYTCEYRGNMDRVRRSLHFNCNSSASTLKVRFLPFLSQSQLRCITLVSRTNVVSNFLCTSLTSLFMRIGLNFNLRNFRLSRTLRNHMPQGSSQVLLLCCHGPRRRRTMVLCALPLSLWGGAQVAFFLRIPMITTTLSCRHCRLTNTPKQLTM